MTIGYAGQAGQPYAPCAGDASPMAPCFLSTSPVARAKAQVMAPAPQAPQAPAPLSGSPLSGSPLSGAAARLAPDPFHLASPKSPEAPQAACRRPSAASDSGSSSEASEGASRGRGICMRIRNTFLDSPPARSESLERFYGSGRRARSTPPIGSSEEVGLCSLDEYPLEPSFLAGGHRPPVDRKAVLAKPTSPQGSFGEESEQALVTPRTKGRSSSSTEASPAALPSQGSRLHETGNCKPCAFSLHGRCKSGTDCEFCHLCEPGERKRRKKEWRALRREGQQDK